MPNGLIKYRTKRDMVERLGKALQENLNDVLEVQRRIDKERINSQVQQALASFRDEYFQYMADMGTRQLQRRLEVAERLETIVKTKL